MMDKWDKRFLALAELVAGWSKDPSTQVGAVIVDARHRVISVGFNGLPSGVPDKTEWLDDRYTKLRLVIHAEENALLFAPRPVHGATCYTWPLLPCGRCAAKLIQAGVQRIIAPADGLAHWAEENRLAKDLFTAAGVEVTLATARQEHVSDPGKMVEVQKSWQKRWHQEDL